MKRTTLGLMSTAALAVIMATSNLAVSQTPVRYSIKDLGVVGGSPGQPFQITRGGLISGVVVSNGAAQATLWYQRLKLNIGGHSLGGNNSVAFAGNDWVQVVGEAETSTPDPNHEEDRKSVV